MSNWEKAVQEKYGFDAAHLHTSHNMWIIESWDNKIYPELINNSSLTSKLDKLHQDLAQSNKINEGPLSQQLLTGQLSFIKKPNILTNIGMNEMAKRSTGETSSVNSYHAIGIGSTSETISDVALENEVGRKIIGSQSTVNQTERYSTSFGDTDIVLPPETISEAGIFTELVGGILIARITAIPVILDTGIFITILTNVIHENGVAL